MSKILLSDINEASERVWGGFSHFLSYSYEILTDQVKVKFVFLGIFKIFSNPNANLWNISPWVEGHMVFPRASHYSGKKIKIPSIDLGNLASPAILLLLAFLQLYLTASS